MGFIYRQQNITTASGLDFEPVDGCLPPDKKTVCFAAAAPDTRRDAQSRGFTCT